MGAVRVSLIIVLFLTGRPATYTADHDRPWGAAAPRQANAHGHRKGRSREPDVWIDDLELPAPWAMKGHRAEEAGGCIAPLAASIRPASNSNAET